MSLQIETRNYTERISKALKDSPFNGLEKVADILLAARKNNKWIFLAGNGGSASNASHFANDMVKGLSVADKPRFRAMALCDATPIMTALANDYDYARVYVEQLKNYASTGDVLILISIIMQRQIEDFLRAVIHGTRPLIDGEEGRKTVEIFTAIYRSNRDGKPVKFPLEPENSGDFDGRLKSQ